MATQSGSPRRLQRNINLQKWAASKKYNSKSWTCKYPPSNLNKTSYFPSMNLILDLILYISREDSLQRLKQNCQGFGWPKYGFNLLFIPSNLWFFQYAHLWMWLAMNNGCRNWMESRTTVKASSYVVLFNHSSVLINQERVPLLTQVVIDQVWKSCYFNQI